MGVGGMEDLTEKPLFALEEQRARQQGILANSNLLRKLQDKGAKVRDSLAKIEAELERRKLELEVVASKQQKKTEVPDVANLEWVLRTTSFQLGRSQNKLTSDGSDNGNAILDSDDDMEGEEDDNQQKLGGGGGGADDESTLLKLIATSQITQRQQKPVLVRPPVKDVKPDPYLLKHIEKDLAKDPKQEKSKFLPGKSLQKKPPGSGSPALSTGSQGSSSPSGVPSKWDEALIPPKLGSEAVKLLSMEDTMKISCDKYKQAEVLKAEAPPKKKYAYDKLRDEGLLGNFTVTMQTSRPVPNDIGSDDDYDECLQEEDDLDLSHDSITEDSESEEDGAKDAKKKKKVVRFRTNQKTVKDLSNILNSSLKLT